jgi:hypothetical protein
MTAYGGAEIWLHLFLTSAQYGRRWSTSNTSPFMLREKPTVLTEQKAGWAQGQSGHFGEEKILLPLPRNKVPDHPVQSCNTYSNS